MKLSSALKILHNAQSKYYIFSKIKQDDREISASENIQKRYLDILSKNKQYHNLLFLVLYHFNNHKFPIQNIRKVLSLTINPTIIDISPNFQPVEEEDSDQNILKTLQQLDESKLITPDIIDYLTYNLIPTLFCGFVEKGSFNSFCLLIQKLSVYYDQHKIQTPLHFLLSRSIFISPLFLTFILKTLNPIFSTFFESQEVQDYDSIKNQIEESFRQNISQLPFFIKNFLIAVGDIKNFLKESLFKPMIFQPEIFLIINFLKTNSKSGKLFFTNLCSQIFEDDLIEKVSEIIEKADCEEYCIKEKMVTLPKEKIISSIDLHVINVIDLLLQQKNDVKKIDLFCEYDDTEYKIFKFKFKNEKKDDENVNLNLTIMNVNDCWIHFNNLLINGPILPLKIDGIDDDEILTVDLFLSIIEKLIIKQSESSELKSSFEYFKHCIQSNQNDSKILTSKYLFTEKINGFTGTFDYKNPILTYVKYLISEILNKMYYDQRYMFFEFNLMFYTFYFKQTNQQIKKIPQKPDKILNDPESYSSNINKCIGLFDESQLINNDSNLFYCECEYQGLIAINVLTNSLSYNEFVSNRPNINELDKAIHTLISHFSNDLFYQNDSCFLKIIRHFDLFDENIQKMRDCFDRNTNPLYKLIGITNIYHEIVDIAHKICDDLGADTIVPLEIYALIKANPTHLFSNFLFLNEYAFKYIMVAQIQSIFYSLFYLLKIEYPDIPFLKQFDRFQ